MMDSNGSSTAQNASTGDYDPSKDQKRKAKSNDPGWKYAYWPELADKNLVRCSLCGRDINGGIKRLKQHLVGGYGDVAKCLKTTAEISREMQKAIMRNKKRKPEYLDDFEEQLAVPVEVKSEGQMQYNLIRPPTQESQASTRVTFTPSSGTAAKRNKTVIQSQVMGPMDAYVRHIPEDVVAERRANGPIQTTTDNCFRDVERKKTCSYIAKWMYEFDIPFNAINSRSFDEMIEAIGQYGPGLKPPTYHEVRVPFLKDEIEQTQDMRKEYEQYWKFYGCTLMSDSWTDGRGRHMINFLVNCPEGTYFMGSVDASSQIQDANLLFQLLDGKIEEIGENYIIHVVTNNSTNYTAAGKLLMEKRTGLYWNPCAVRCLNLMLEDIGNLRAYKAIITKARRITSFIYRHPRLLEAMKAKIKGKDLVRTAINKFATSFLTLQSLLKHKDALRQLFVSNDWINSKLSATEVGKKVADTLLTTVFWNDVEDCIRASQPLLIVLRMVEADERPAMGEIYMAIDNAKRKIKQNFGDKEKSWKKVIAIVDKHWECQMDRPLYAAAFYLNPAKYFDYCASETASDDLLSKVYNAFNEVIIRLVSDETLKEKIMTQSKMYKTAEGYLSCPLVIRQRKSMTPIVWWKINGDFIPDLMRVAIRILGLCCSSSDRDCNRSTFESIYTKKMNRLEHQCLNDLIYIQYNRRLQARVKDKCDQGKKNDPLQLDKLDWSSEWITGQSDEELIHHGDDLTCGDVDRAIEASTSVDSRSRPRRSQTALIGANICYTRRGKGKTIVEESSDGGELEEEEDVNDDEDVDDDFGLRPTTYSTGKQQQLDVDFFDDYDY